MGIPETATAPPMVEADFLFTVPEQPAAPDEWPTPTLRLVEDIETEKPKTEPEQAIPEPEVKIEEPKPPEPPADVRAAALFAELVPVEPERPEFYARIEFFSDALAHASRHMDALESAAHGAAQHSPEFRTHLNKALRALCEVESYVSRQERMHDA
ncbi:MAG: hypothetical protein JWM81_755 [Candidatus Saccharibacteria bacterium]|nr:hypothetical protein [Candidatus Saccharibacteria bacterium]